MLGRVRAKQDVGEQAWFVSNTFGRSESHPRKIWLFLLSLTYVCVSRGNNLEVQLRLMFKDKKFSIFFSRIGKN